jgi:prefoldin subunit 5
MRSIIYLILSLLLFSSQVFAQNEEELRLILPAGITDNIIREGETFRFKLLAEGGADRNYMFSVNSEVSGYEIDKLGNFSWFVDYHTVGASEQRKQIPFTFSVTNEAGEGDSIEVRLNVMHELNRTSSQAGLAIDFPQRAGWNLLSEGDTLIFKLSVSEGGRELEGFTFFMEGNQNTDMLMDSLGDFFWTPDFDFVSRLEQTRDSHIVFFAEDKNGRNVSEKVIFTVFHKNRPPVAEPVPTFYAVSGTQNVFEITEDRISDPDGDPIVIVPIPSEMPQGAKLSSTGRFTWQPSRRQFLDLANNPIEVGFYLEDQPAKERTRISFIIEASQLDLAPVVTAVPPDTVFVMDEDQFLNINFYISDPNGEQDIMGFDFVSEDIRVTKDALRKNTETQYEFVWKPGYEFVEDPLTEIDFNIRFFAFDGSNNTTEHSIYVKVKDTENLLKRDADMYAKYYDALAASLDMLNHVQEVQRSAEKDLRKAKKGKKNRALFGAGVGAITGLSPVIFSADNQVNTQKVVSGVGGTTTMTLGTLEARDAIGKSLTELNNKIKTSVDLQNKINAEASAFARRYNTKAARRLNAFESDRDKLLNLLNSEDIVLLGLDPTWKNPKPPNNRRLKQSFPDFNTYEN